MPLLTVAIPTRNRSAFLNRLLESLSKMKKVSFDWEILVVDNGSTDNTHEIFQKWQNLMGNLRYVIEPVPGHHEARNRSAMEAQGKYIGYLDDDMVLCDTWIQGCLPIEEGRAEATVGRILLEWEAEPPEWVKKELLTKKVWGPLGLMNMGDEEVPIPYYHIFGGNCFVPRKMVLEFGGFNPEYMPDDKLQYGGDGETGFFQKFHERSYRGLYTPVATAWHYTPLSRISSKYLCRRFFIQGISDAYTKIRNHHKSKTQKGDNPFCGMNITELGNYIDKNPIHHEVLLQEMKHAQMAGEDFLMKSLCEYPNLLDYIKQSNYMQGQEKLRDTEFSNAAELFMDFYRQEAAKAPANGSQEALYIESHVLWILKNISANEKQYLLFGAGAHTRWLLNLIAKHDLKKPLFILDDKVASKEIDGIKILATNEPLSTQAHIIILSSDTIQEKFKLRCKELFGTSIEIIDLYDGFPPGPYEKIE